MNLIEDDQALLIGPEKQGRVGKLAAICARFQVEIERVRACGYFVSQRCLADLPRADQGYRGLTA